MSGLQMNHDKTKVIWIGSKKNSQVQFLRDMNFCLDPGIIKVLGMTFSTSTDQINVTQYEAKLDEMKTILKT